MNKMMAATISAGATTRAVEGTASPPEAGVDHSAADRHEN